MKKVFKVLSIILAAIMVVLLCIYLFVLQYPKLKDDPKIDKWYRVTTSDMKASDGSRYRALFKKGSENKVIVYFAGGGVSVNEETARDETFNTKELPIDFLANFTMNMGGIATASDVNPFKDWTVIAFPYATGDFHAGTGEFKFTDKKGKKKTLYHNGYTNFTMTMKEVIEHANIRNPDAVLVTGYSAGGWGASLLSDDVFTNYFPEAKSKTVLVDSSLLLNDDWHSIATDVWKSPKHISDRLVSNNITLDSLTALHKKWGDQVNILFDSSTRDGDLAKVQNYFDAGKMEVDEGKTDIYQQILKESIPKFKKQAGAHLFLWDGLPWYDDPRNLTMHTIIATPHFLDKFENVGMSISDWTMNAVNGNLEDHGLDLVNKTYPSTVGN
ncbi:pectin acetylesterase-family hydrolase [Paenibacillus amylolyticus]|nr:pectin acetylesterase-family hydrolase [Paenibacillus amylolyticus]WFR60951.1 pectin acetylesterase-family hydrolase [Paenibacillus amylolyticus]